MLQTGSLQWQSCSHAGPTSHSVSFGGESVECDALRNGIASTWGGSKRLKQKHIVLVARDCLEVKACLCPMSLVKRKMTDG